MDNRLLGLPDQAPVAAIKGTPHRRWEHEDVLERVQKQIDDNPDRLAIRSMTVAHPFGTIKSWMGATHFTMRRMKQVATEIALHVLACNFTRVMAIIGIPAMIKAMVA